MHYLPAMAEFQSENRKKRTGGGLWTERSSLAGAFRLNDAARAQVPGCLLCFWKGKIKGGAFIHLALCPGAPAVPRDDAAHVCQPDAGALKIDSTMQALEYTEK